MMAIYGSYFQFAYNVIHMIIRTRNFKSDDYNVRTVSILGMFYIIKRHTRYVENNVYGKNYDLLAIKTYLGPI